MQLFEQDLPNMSSRLSFRLCESSVPLTMSGVTLDLFQPDDVTENYVRWLNDESVMQFTEARFEAHEQEKARAYVAASNEGNRARLWRIVADDFGHIGNIRLSDVNWHHRRASVAILIGDKRAWGHGFGRRAVALASWYALHVVELHKLTAGMYEQNLGSIRAFEHVGYHREALLHRHYLLNGNYQAGIQMACFRDDLLLAPDKAT